MLHLIAIVGPTGAGKSTLAVRVAEEFQGEVVNCDSLQLYRGFDVGTAKLPEAARRAIPHHLIDVLEPDQVYSAGDYARDARQAIAAISARQHLPVVAGGTGFYLRALLNGLPQLPSRDTEIRTNLAARETARPGTIRRLLERLDPEAARRIHPRDVQKSIRALEIRLLTRNPTPPADSAEPLTGYRTLTIGLGPDRTVLFQILDARAREMFRCGLLEEVENLLSAGVTAAVKPFESLGYRQAVNVLRGSMTLEQAIASTQLETRQYAKRQCTWFRHDKKITWLSGFGNDADVIESCFRLVRLFIG
jgi:tRNA dimethylallyltransferase